MIIVCGCEGQLYLMADNRTLVCGNCRKTYPGEDVETILKLLSVADYKPSDEVGQTAPTEPEIRNALRMAAIKAARLKLRLIEKRVEPQRVPVHRGETVVPTPAPPVGWGWTETVNSAVNTRYQRIVIQAGGHTWVFDIG